jgi:hypothetical protein
LRSASQAAAPNAVIGEQVASLLSLALQRMRAKDTAHAFSVLGEALKYDPGILITPKGDVGSTIQSHLPCIIAEVKFPSTLTWLAALSGEAGKSAARDALLSRYLEIAPDAPDGNHILCDRCIERAVQHAGRREFELAHHALREALHYEFGIDAQSGSPSHPVFQYIQMLLETVCSPALVAGFAFVAHCEAQCSAAIQLYGRYLELNPEAFDREAIEELIRILGERMRRSSAPPTLWLRAIERLRRLVSPRRSGATLPEHQSDRAVPGCENPAIPPSYPDPKPSSR